MPELTPEELERTNARFREFIARIKAVPEADRVLLTSDKFAGPIATQLVEPDGVDDALPRPPLPGVVNDDDPE